MGNSNFVNGWLRRALHNLSPNFNQRPYYGNNISNINAIIIHGISLPKGEFGGQDIDELFCNSLDCTKHPDYQNLYQLTVSAHFLIRRDGHLTQYVSTENRAWHAGSSILNGEENCNNFSIGIELEGVDDIPYEDCQYQELICLINELKQLYPEISNDRIVGHSDVAPFRKTDPGEAFDWNRLNKALEESC